MDSSLTTTPGAPRRLFNDPPVSDEISEETSRLRSTKRKLDHAFQSLDTAVGSFEDIQSQPPKRPHTIRSLYSTLARYGIKSKDTRSASRKIVEALPTSKSTPRLTAILTRAANRTRKALPFKFVSSKDLATLPPGADYRPSSLPAFLSRLHTFTLTTYGNKPPSIDAVAASKCGWINEGKNRLVCGLCKSSWVVANRDGMGKDSANALVEKQHTLLVEMHKDGCPWKARQCDPTIYRIPLKSPSAMVTEIKTNAMALEPLLRNIQIKHPLTSTQLSSLLSTISSTKFPSQTPQDTQGSESDDIFTQGFSVTESSTVAILTSLFGWNLTPATQDLSQPLSRSGSLAPSATRRSSPSISRASSVQPVISLPHGSPAVTPTRVPSAQFTFRIPSNISLKNDNTVLQCSFCKRRVGLWAFIPQTPPTNTAEPKPQVADGDITMEPEVVSEVLVVQKNSTILRPKNDAQRQFDLLKEHRSYCPYVVRSTIVPMLPAPPTASVTPPTHARPNSVASQPNEQSEDSAAEGWRAILTVILRHGIAQRHRLGLDFVDRLRGEPQIEDPLEADSVKVMVEGVKSRGGRDLLKYVKMLLG